MGDEHAETGIAHIGVAVNDLDASIVLFRDIFGVNASEIRESPKDRVRGAMLDFGNARIELIQPTAPDTAVAKFIERRGEGIHHIAFHAPEGVGATLDRLKAQGIQLIDQEPRKGMFETVGFVHPRSTRGVLMEFVEETPRQQE